jgi:hypothetical protein
MRELFELAHFCLEEVPESRRMKVLAESKLRVPEDVAIVGYDHTDICLGLTPTLTTIDRRAEQVGRYLLPLVSPAIGSSEPGGLLRSESANRFTVRLSSKLVLKRFRQVRSDIAHASAFRSWRIAIVPVFSQADPDSRG